MGPGAAIREAAVLSLLAEESMHGYQIIHEIEERSGGAWRPSARSVYPTLQLLADEGLIASEEKNGRKTYSLTDVGREASGARHGGRVTALPKAGMELTSTSAQVADRHARAGRAGRQILDEARRKLYSLLAQG